MDVQPERGTIPVSFLVRTISQCCIAWICNCDPRKGANLNLAIGSPFLFPLPLSCRRQIRRQFFCSRSPIFTVMLAP